MLQVAHERLASEQLESRPVSCWQESRLTRPGAGIELEGPVQVPQGTNMSDIMCLIVWPGASVPNQTDHMQACMMIEANQLIRH